MNIFVIRKSFDRTGGGHQITGTKIAINNQISLRNEREPGVSSTLYWIRKKAARPKLKCFGSLTSK